jgi:hypothetical protein
MIALTCPETNISNAEILYLNTSLGGLVNYSCNTGSRHEKGDLLRMCVNGGSWSGEKPVCKSKIYASVRLDSISFSSSTNTVATTHFDLVRNFSFR